MDKKQIKGIVCDYHKRTRSDVLIDDDINTDEFFSIGDEISNEWMADDNIDDHIVKNHLEMIVDQVANDKEFYIFDSLIQGRSFKDISNVLEYSEQSVRLWYETLLDKIVEVIE
ncbi:TPA: pathogenicity island protein [Staphylococcus aureus]|nr:pathogenicity island protein [Staphylococcus aureus]HBC4239597.1 pathogenicity island protein [Staphylococcus aureus]HBC4241981.1 pathogenicity island protein [Staphylococcus aureus]